jgi:hypothetical protein
MQHHPALGDPAKLQARLMAYYRTALQMNEMWAASHAKVTFFDGCEGPPLFVNSDVFVNIVMPALTLQNNDGPPLFANNDAFVNIACLHTHMPLACQWND